jgi:exopolysaccharide production protein ExoZ
MSGGLGTGPIGGKGTDKLPTISEIQALRAIAAASVVACHLNQIQTFLTGQQPAHLPLSSLQTGVDLFFVISGFIMVHSSEPLFAAPGGAYDFLARRIARIAPLYWITTIVGVWIFAPTIEYVPILKSLFFLPFAQPNGAINPVHGVGWTLNYEMFFYVIFAAAIFLPRLAASIVVIVSLVSIVIAGWWFAPQAAPLRFWSDSIILEFTFGMIIAELYRRRIELAPWLRIVLASGAALTIFEIDRHMPASFIRSLHWGIPAALIVAATLLGKPLIRIGALEKTANLLGNSSYALYLIHPFCGTAVYVLWPRLNALPMMPVLIGAGILAQLLAIVIYQIIERPLTNIFRGIFERWRGLRIGASRRVSATG